MCIRDRIDECNLTHEQLSVKLSKNRSTISNFLRLLKLPVEVQKALRDSKITMGHARALLSFNSEAEILSAFKKIISESLSVRDAEKMNHKKKLPNEEKVILSSYELRMQNNISFQLLVLNCDKELPKSCDNRYHFQEGRLQNKHYLILDSNFS